MVPVATAPLPLPDELLTEVQSLRRDLALVRVRLHDAQREIVFLTKRLNTIASCTESRCWLCSSCLNAAGLQ